MRKERGREAHVDWRRNTLPCLCHEAVDSPLACTSIHTASASVYILSPYSLASNVQ